MEEGMMEKSVTGCEFEEEGLMGMVPRHTRNWIDDLMNGLLRQF
jgi:hypothetical protein